MTSADDDASRDELQALVAMSVRATDRVPESTVAAAASYLRWRTSGDIAFLVTDGNEDDRPAREERDRRAERMRRLRAAVPRDHRRGIGIKRLRPVRQREHRRRRGHREIAREHRWGSAAATVFHGGQADHRQVREGRRPSKCADDIAIGHRDVPRYILAREPVGEPAFERDVVGLRRGERLGGEIGAAERVETDELLERRRDQQGRMTLKAAREIERDLQPVFAGGIIVGMNEYRAHESLLWPSDTQDNAPRGATVH